MIIITASLVLGLVIAGVAFANRRSDDAQLTEPRASLPTMGIQIICGNCAGEDERPNRTYLDRFGDCSQCGGHSYLLASTLYAQSQYAQSQKGGQASQVEAALSSGRVLSFNAQRPKRSVSGSNVEIQGDGGERTLEAAECEELPLMRATAVSNGPRH
jgi:hypothetical protein